MRRVHGSSFCARHSLIQCKILHRIHYTKARLSRIYENVSPTCDRCQHAPADLMHSFWLCPSLSNFWTQIFISLSEISGEDVEPCPVGALFGVFPLLPSLSRAKKDAMAFVTLLARRLILLKWKSPVSPSHTHWMRDILYFLKLEKIRLSLNGSSEKFSKIWSPFFLYLQRIRFPFIPD